MSKAQNLLDLLDENIFSRAKEAILNRQTRLSDKYANQQRQQQTFGKYDRYMKAQHVATGSGAVNRAQRVLGKAKEALKQYGDATYAKNIASHKKARETLWTPKETFGKAKETFNKYIPDQRPKYNREPSSTSYKPEPNGVMKQGLDTAGYTQQRANPKIYINNKTGDMQRLS